MESASRGGSGLTWWVGWVLWCVPAGALAGVGRIELNWGGPPYDGGFLGELALFGGFLALGQAPFVAVFVLILRARAGNGGAGAGRGAGPAWLWPLAGFVGWTLGSYLEVGFAAPLYSTLGVLAGVVPWLLVGVLEGVVLMATLASLGEWWVEDGRPSVATGTVGGSRVGPRLSVRTLVAAGAVWALASTVGGLLYEYWDSFDLAARQNPVKDSIGAYLEGAGVAERIAFEVVPGAMFLPILYGIPTGLALFAISRLVLREA